MPPSSGPTSGRVQEVYRNSSEIRCLWRVPRSLTADSLLTSPSFSWLGTLWHFKMNPRGRPLNFTAGWVEVFIVTSRAPKKPVRVTIGIQKVDETERLAYRDRKFENSDRLCECFQLVERYELLRYASQLTHKGALIVSFLIRAIETTPPSKDNPIQTTDLGIIGDIKETRRNSGEIDLEWKIPKILTLSDGKGDHYSSTDVEFLNTKWNLRIYLNGYSTEGSGDWVGVNVQKSDLSNCKKPVRVVLGIKKPGAKDKTIFQEQVMPEYRRLCSVEKFIERKQLSTPKEKLLYFGGLTIICTLLADEASTEGEASSSQAVAVSTPETFECFRENFRSSNEIGFEWKIPEFHSLLETRDCHSSPTVDFVDTSWRLKIYPFGRKSEESYGWMGLEVWKVDWSSCQVPVYLSLGIKKGDSTEMILRNQELLKHRRLWRTPKFILRDELLMRKDILLPSDVLTISILLCTEEASPVTNLGGDIFWPFDRTIDVDGVIRERECNYHKEVEWDVKFPSEKVSPAFVIGSQSYWLKWYCEGPPKLASLDLCSLGPPIGLSQSAVWWAGLKRQDGTHLFTNTSGVLGLEEDDGKWVQRDLYRIPPIDLAMEYEGNDTTVFLRISVERTPKEAEICSHVYPGKSEIPFPPKEKSSEDLSASKFCYNTDLFCRRETRLYEEGGTIDNQTCSHHNQIEWNIPNAVRTLLTAQHVKTPKLQSPEFSFLAHKFKLEWTTLPGTYGDIILNVYSRDEYPLSFGRWWAALKRCDGTFCIKNLRGELKPDNACEIWTLRGSLVFGPLELIEEKVNVVFRYAKEEASLRTNSCIHGDMDMPLPSVGDIREEMFPSYKQVEWSMEYEPEPKHDLSIISPQFVMGRERYVLEFTQEFSKKGSVVLHLHRQEIPIAESECSRFVQWWAGWRRRNGTYYYKNRRGKLDLQEESETWRQIYLNRIDREELEKTLLTPDSRVSIFIRLSEDRTVENPDTNEKEEIVLDFKQQQIGEDSEVVFHVRGMEFKIPRAIIGDRLPVLNAMFQYDTIEKRTGVINIEDSEPSIIKEFLHYICYGFLHKLTCHNTFPLYTVADKYLVDDLKIEIVQFIIESMSSQDFCDLFSFAVDYGEDDLLKAAIDFFSKNHKNIMKHDDWFTFQRENRAIAYSLLSVLLKRPQTFKDNLYKSFARNKMVD